MLIEFENDERDKYDIEEGFINGNMFKELYKGYKDYKPKKPKIMNNKEHELYKLMMVDFAINDINLFLALNPKNEEYIRKLTEYNKVYDELKKEYENKYGVLNFFQENKNKYSYIENPWPWEGFNV